MRRRVPSGFNWTLTRGLLSDAENRTVKYETPEDGAAVRRNV